eukprot:7891372-Pyramimonas_sp.AAC.1
MPGGARLPSSAARDVIVANTCGCDLARDVRVPHSEAASNGRWIQGWASLNRSKLFHEPEFVRCMKWYWHARKQMAPKRVH